VKAFARMTRLTQESRNPTLAPPESELANREYESSASSLAWLATIRARLYIAFGFAASVTVVGSLIALTEFTSIGETTAQIVTHSMPTAVQSLRLAEETSALLASVPQLMAVLDEPQRVAAAGAIGEQTRNLSSRIERLRLLDGNVDMEIDGAADAMVERLATLNSAVSDRIVISGQRRAMALSVRKAHQDLLEEITPIVDDANFDLMMASRARENQISGDLLESLRRLLEVEAEANLLAGLLIEASLLDDIARLQPLHDLIGAAHRKIESNLEALGDAGKRNKLIVLYDRLAAMAGNNGLVALRSRELSSQYESELAFTATQFEATKLKQAVDRLVEQQRADSQVVTGTAQQQIQRGQILLIVLSCFAIGAAGMIAWLYVGRSIAGRLELLGVAMRRIAAGELSVAIPTDGQDEISDMARTLLVFRSATAEVAAARKTEARRTHEAESRHHQMGAATQTFERAVLEIVGALDNASKTMDASARALTQSASRNQGQALSTAAASEEATTNVESVAAASDRIAQSVEHISFQVRDSASVARQAASEAEAVTAAVEGVARSVGQIGDVSDLIRKIASQTNLLALNATIEAARAGDAGRGFAVVAQEVKSLASQTEKATQDITRRIALIETTTSQAVDAMKIIAKTITRLDDIAKTVSCEIIQQGAVTQQIASSAGAAAYGTRQVAMNIVQVAHAATETEEMATIVLTAAVDLSARSDTLKGEVDRFLAQVRAA